MANKGFDILDAAEKIRQINQPSDVVYKTKIHHVSSTYRVGFDANLRKYPAYNNWLKILEQSRNLQQSHVQDDVFELRKEIDKINILFRKANKRIETLESQIKTIKDIIPEQKTIVLREITRDEAISEIENLFKTGDTLYYSDIAEKLRLDLEMVVEICQELLQKGKIKVANAS